jgi:NADH dehydrogenase FAD-containing subunit
MALSKATVLDSVTTSPVSFTTNILVVGGAYAGLSAINTFITQHKTKIKTLPNKFTSKNRLSLTLVEPRAGLLNVLGMPRCILDSEFAATQFVPYDRLSNFRPDKIVSLNKDLVSKWNLPGESSENYEVGIEVNYVHGRVTYLDEQKAQYNLVNAESSEVGDSLAIIDFDYVILASGRDRNWPTTPCAFTYDSFLQEMKKSMDRIDAHDIISIVGAGAVGIELAGDLKHYRPDKQVNLIHPYGHMPPEEHLVDEFKRLTLESVKNAGVNVILNTRVNADKSIHLGTTEGDLTTTTGATIKSGLNIWCTAHKNNTWFLSKDIKHKYVTPGNDVRVNEYLQLYDSATNTVVPNFFVLGDLAALDIIKSAGWALYHGRQVANNLTSLILENKLVEPHANLAEVPRGMVLVAGNGDLICQLGGVISKNVPEYVEEYRDYCFGKIRATLDV